MGLRMLLSLDGADGETPRHCHAEGQIFIVHRGAMTVTTDNGRWLMPPGRLGWFPPYCDHSAGMHGAVTGLSLYVPAPRVEALPPDPCVFTPSPLAVAVLERMAEVGEGSRRDHLLLVLLDELALARPEPLHIPMPTDPRLMILARALLDSPADPRSLQEWAAAVGLSRRTLMRRLTAETGLGFAHWRQRVRLMAALPMLAAGVAVTTVALDVGFESVSTFIAAFRAYFQITPARYFAVEFGRRPRAGRP